MRKGITGILAASLLASACEDVSTSSAPAQCPAANATALGIVAVTGSHDRSDYPLSNTLDGSMSSFTTTPTLSLGEVVEIAYQLASPTDLASLDVEDNYTNVYSLGDLEVLASSDSTNGYDGSWQLAATLTAATNQFTQGDGAVAVSAACVSWIRLRMTYNGSGAYGATPAFYLSEIRFYGP